MTLERPDDLVRNQLAALRLDVEARAAGYWWVAGEWLEQLAFVPSLALPEEVAHGFAEATRTVSLAQSNLGIVQAALSGTVTVSRASELPDDAGSGYWLRAFGATRSIAVPLHVPGGPVRAVVSVALADTPLDDDSVAERVVATARAWVPLV
jgi:DNA-binding IclR family transcriptional regulator